MPVETTETGTPSKEPVKVRIDPHHLQYSKGDIADPWRLIHVLT